MMRFQTIIFLSAAVSLAGCTALGGQTGQTDGVQVPVGDNAWSERVSVNITGEVEPSTVTVGGEEMLVWENKNSFPVTVELRNVDRTFTVGANGSFAFKPAQSFDYTVSGQGSVLDSGRVEVQ